ncbi:MAG: LysM peptidoglycan-binding domain-containing protein [Bacteroidetes bacterium]|nr:MAG: LysM peptidoglycan-binding domain-containing protein [Bacteroidota bacterium]
MKKIIRLMGRLFTISTGMVLTLVAFSGQSTAEVLSSDTNSAVTLMNSYRPFHIQSATPIQVNESEVRAGLLYDVENKKVIWQKNMHSAYPIASLTKMMVALLAVEDIRDGKFTWDDKIQWTRVQYSGRGKSRRKINVSVNYSLRDVFKATMIASNNECSEQLARYLGNGDLPSTIRRMNARARELQMQNTFYGNPTGLPASSWMNDNASTPTDQLLLTLEMLQYEEILEIAGMGYASIENGRAASVIKNHNKLTIEYSGEVDGLKTGYTRRAGFCLVATTAKCEHRLIGIVFGCRAPLIRNEVVKDMFNDYYTSIGLDKLGPYCENPMLAKQSSPKGINGELVTLKESVKKTHLVRSGESLSAIAAKYRCTVPELKRWNSKTVRSSTIHPGQHLTIYDQAVKKVFIQKPDNGTEEEDENSIVENSNVQTKEATAIKSSSSTVAKKTSTVSKAAPKETNYVFYTVVPGDTLTSIARKYEGTTVEQLKSINSIKDAKSIKPGMKIKVLVQS